MNSRQFAIVAGITFLVGMIWLAADIIFNTKASIPISTKLQTLIETVNPNFNARVLEIIDKEVLSRDEIVVKSPAETSPPTIQPTQPEATESADLNQ